MNISALVSHAISATGHGVAGRISAAPKASEAASYDYGPLSDQQLKTLRAAVGYDFNWPPTADSGAFPLAAVVLSQRDMSSDIAAQKQLTASGLRELAAAGLLSATDVARGTAFLRNGSAATSD